jgi:hypothetical protein
MNPRQKINVFGIRLTNCGQSTENSAGSMCCGKMAGVFMQP